MSDLSTVRELIDFGAEKYKGKDFCRFLRNGEVVTKSYEQFRLDALAMCRFIRNKEKKRLHIAFIGKTNYEYVACLTGLIISNNTVVPFSPDITVEEACLLFEDGDIEILYCEESFLPKAEEIKTKCPRLKEIVSLGDISHFGHIFEEYSKPEYESLSDIPSHPDEIALIIYTSGTTGNKKGVMLTSRNLAANSSYDTYAMEDGEATLSILPMHHIFCYACDVLKTLYDGGVVCLNGDLAKLYDNFHIFNPSVMRIVPALCKSLLTRIKIYEKNHPGIDKREAAEAIVGTGLRRLIAGSAFLSGYLVDEFEKYGITARQGYGMSECSPRITTSDFSDNHKYSNGVIIGVDEVRTVDGEIQVKGPSVMKGYYKRPDATAEAFTEDGFLHTGDLGYIEDDHIYLIGRQKNLIILSNGENISPEEIENKFCDEECIKELVVFEKNDKLCAEIFPAEEATEKDIEDAVQRVNINSASDRQIFAFYLRSCPFERTTTGKLKRQNLYYNKEDK